MINHKTEISQLDCGKPVRMNLEIFNDANNFDFDQWESLEVNMTAKSGTIEKCVSILVNMVLDKADKLIGSGNGFKHEIHWNTFKDLGGGNVGELFCCEIDGSYNENPIKVRATFDNIRKVKGG